MSEERIVQCEPDGFDRSGERTYRVTLLLERPITADEIRKLADTFNVMASEADKIEAGISAADQMIKRAAERAATRRQP